MFNKIIIFNLFLSVFANYKSNSSLDPIIIRGNVSMVELNEDIPLYLSMVEGHPFAYLNINIYIDNVLTTTDREISKYLSNKYYSLGTFTNKNRSKKIKVEVNYEGTDTISSTCEFKVYSPHYGNIKNAGSSKIMNKDKNAIGVSFQAQGNENSVEYEYEQVNFFGIWAYECKHTRFFDFSKYSISASSNIDLKDTFLEFKIYESFQNSDLLYKSNYTSLDISFKKQADNSLIGENEFKFFINKNTGMIFENETIECDKEALPFFFPFSIKTESLIQYSLNFYDVGKNHNNYIFSGVINVNYINESDKFGSVLDFIYQEKEPFKDIIYA